MPFTQAGGMAHIGAGFNGDTGQPALLDVGTTAFERNGIYVARTKNFGGI
jgi:hypothetical protein